MEKSLRKEGALERLKQLGEAFSTVTEWTHPNIEAKLKELAASLGVKVGELVHPARVAVSGRSVGPGLYEMMEVLGKDRVLSRFARAATI